MKKLNKPLLFLTSVIILLPIVYGIIVWDKLPAQIAVHFDANSVPNGWASRGFAVYGMPLIMCCLHLFALIVTANDKRRENIDNRMMAILMWVVPVVSVVTSYLTYGYALGEEMNIGFIVLSMLGILFVVLGNYMPKCKQNWVVGIRIPSTLRDTENWNMTHRVAGYCLTIGGFLVLLSAYFGNPIISLVILITICLIPIIYSISYEKSHR